MYCMPMSAEWINAHFSTLSLVRDLFSFLLILIVRIFFYSYLRLFNFPLFIYFYHSLLLLMLFSLFSFFLAAIAIELVLLLSASDSESKCLRCICLFVCLPIYLMQIYAFVRSAYFAFDLVMNRMNTVQIYRCSRTNSLFLSRFFFSLVLSVCALCGVAVKCSE